MYSCILYYFRALENVQILLHGTEGESMEYTTKIFERVNTPPFWKETQSQKLSPNVESALVVVIDMGELKDNATSKVEFNAVIIYKNKGYECILPVDAVTVSSIDTMGELFDVMCNDLSGEYGPCMSFTSTFNTPMMNMCRSLFRKGVLYYYTLFLLVLFIYYILYIHIISWARQVPVGFVSYFPLFFFM